MTVFKTFWRIANKYKGTIILYTVMLVVFGSLNMKTQDKELNFVDSKPDVLIVNNDKNSLIVKNLKDYFKKSSNIKDVKNIDDALFYRDVNYIIYIPKGYTDSVLNKEFLDIDVKSTGDYMAYCGEMLLKKYLSIEKVYAYKGGSEEEIVKNINKSLNTSTDVSITSKLDTSKTSKMATYFNFASYSIMATVIFVICLVMSSFKDRNVNKRILVSSVNYKKFNNKLIISSLVYALGLFILVIVLGIILLHGDMFSLRGVIYALNVLLFIIVSLTLALLISNLFNNKEAISGIVNVIALGSAFLCGAFVPAEYLPLGVLKIAHVLPAYWYINTNDILKSLEVINVSNLKNVFINFGVLILFVVIFIILNNLVTKYKRNNGV